MSRHCNALMGNNFLCNREIGHDGEHTATVQVICKHGNNVCLQCATKQAYWAEVCAKDFHETYERLAPKFGYETRKESAKPWAEVPENNRKLMTAVVAEVITRWNLGEGAER